MAMPKLLCTTVTVHLSEFIDKLIHFCYTIHMDKPKICTFKAANAQDLPLLQ